MEVVWTSETLVSYHNTTHGLTTQTTWTWIITAGENLKTSSSPASPRTALWSSHWYSGVITCRSLLTWLLYVFGARSAIFMNRRWFECRAPCDVRLSQRHDLFPSCAPHRYDVSFDLHTCAYELLPVLNTSDLHGVNSHLLDKNYVRRFERWLCLQVGVGNYSDGLIRLSYSFY